MKQPKIAVVYDWLDKWGGVERILLNLHDLFPSATFFTSYYDEKTALWARKLKVKTSFIQSLPSFIKKSRILSLPLYPYAFEAFDFSPFDSVISVTSSFAKGVITKPSTKHLCYLLTPTRYLWSQPESYLHNRVYKTGGVLLGSRLRRWDSIAAQRPDKIVAISEKVAKRSKKYYSRDAEVIYPPFDIQYWQSLKFDQIWLPEKYFLVVSRLESYKSVDIVLEAFKKREENLVIVGKGSEKQHLLKKAGKNCFFMENLTDSQLGYVYSRAQALVMPQEEDFGYVSLEAQCFGCPVITFRESGAAETVLEGKTGLFIDDQTSGGVIEALERFDKISYNLKTQFKENAQNYLLKFTRTRFEQEFMRALKETL